MARVDTGSVGVVWGLRLRGSGAEEEGWRGTVVEGRTPLGLVALDAGTREEGRVAGRTSPAWHSVISRIAWRGGGIFHVHVHLPKPWKQQNHQNSQQEWCMCYRTTENSSMSSFPSRSMSDKFQIYKRKDTSGEKEDERTESFDELNRSTVDYLSQSVYG